RHRRGVRCKPWDHSWTLHARTVGHGSRLHKAEHKDFCALLFGRPLEQGGVRYFVSQLAPHLSTVRISRRSVSFIPRNAAVLADVDDINNNVGFWQPQADFRIVERIDAVPSTFASFPDTELEAIYEELVREFVAYQTNVALRAITRFPNVDL